MVEALHPAGPDEGDHTYWTNMVMCFSLINPLLQLAVAMLAPKLERWLQMQNILLSKQASNVLDRLKAMGIANRKQVADAMGLPYQNVRYHIDRLEKLGIIKRVGGCAFMPADAQVVL